MQNTKNVKLGIETYWIADSQQVIRKGKPVALTSNMSKCILLLIMNRSRPVKNTEIYYFIWNEYFNELSAKKVRSLISDIRKRIPSLNILNCYGGYYILEKYHEPFPDIKEYFFDILDQTQVGITITDPNQVDNPVIYVNEIYLDTFGYEREEVLGRNLRYLQGDDRDQDGLEPIRKAILEKQSATTVLRNYHKSGRLIYNELTISPIFDKQTLELKYFIGVQKDITSSYTKAMNQILSS